MIHPSTDLVEYSTASAMAECYEREMANIRRLMIELGEAKDRLARMFIKEGGYGSDFGFSINYRTRLYALDEVGASQIEAYLHRAAWAALVDKLDIRKLMSSAAVKKLNEQLEGKSRYDEKPEPLPDITADNIMAVLTDMIGRSGEFLEEKIREEYNWWRPHTERHVTDNVNCLDEKLIKGWVVERGFHRCTWDVRYDYRCHVTALDSVMHMLDGAGISESYDGDLLTAIRAADITGKGESKYFKFACFKNGNIHLRFKRLDLLALFNQVAAGQNLPQARDKRRGTTAV